MLLDRMEQKAMSDRPMAVMMEMKNFHFSASSSSIQTLGTLSASSTSHRAAEVTVRIGRFWRFCSG